MDQAYKCDYQFDCCRKDDDEEGNSTCSDTTDEEGCGTFVFELPIKYHFD